MCMHNTDSSVIYLDGNLQSITAMLHTVLAYSLTSRRRSWRQWHWDTARRLSLHFWQCQKIISGYLWSQEHNSRHWILQECNVRLQDQRLGSETIITLNCYYISPVKWCEIANDSSCNGKRFLRFTSYHNADASSALTGLCCVHCEWRLKEHIKFGTHFSTLKPSHWKWRYWNQEALSFQVFKQQANTWIHSATVFKSRWMKISFPIFILQVHENTTTRPQMVILRQPTNRVSFLWRVATLTSSETAARARDKTIWVFFCFFSSTTCFHTPWKRTAISWQPNILQYHNAPEGVTGIMESLRRVSTANRRNNSQTTVQPNQSEHMQWRCVRLIA